MNAFLIFFVLVFGVGNGVEYLCTKEGYNCKYPGKYEVGFQPLASHSELHGY